VLFRLRVRARAWPEDEREGRVARRIVGHPLASALQVGTVVGLGLYDEKPTVVAIAVYLVAVSSAAVVFVGLLLPRQRRLLGIAVVLLCADLVRILLGELAYLERVLLIGELAIFALLLAYLLRRPDWKDLGLSERATASLRFVVWVWIWGSGVGAVAVAAGYGHVAEIAGAGMLRSMFLALAYAGLLEASTSVLWIVLQTEPAKKINFVREHRTLVVQRLSTLFTWIAVALWAKGTLSYLTLLDTFVNASKELLKTALEVGALKISVGDVLALVFGTVLAVYVARLLRFVLDQDLLGRITMSEGTRQVAGSSIYWAALLFGLFASVAAAGIGLENLTVLAGALGVGVGFGLQNVVQNFVGGLILLFGGFIKVGHQIQLAELMGEVRTIGFWASTVRTLQGAEVIVPNALLISDKVINWTLSDPKRRVELDIGIEYGTDPDRILAILLEVARSNEKVLVEPPPEALFVKHGESSLDFQLRAWVTFNDFEPISSELTVALNKRLVEERIGIPFPQCDMNILSISPEAATTLLNTRGTPST
jgi:small-conductance mechanosensitive channel